ncbi:MAG TPA: HAD-IA family hydrolase, partial [Chakrabartia sp.]|nr:HAD-IA family hydrolase [Chakrabartia sp.]
MTYTTVIFDFGGVVTSSPFEAFNRLEAERGLPHNLVRQVNSTNPDTNAWAKFERAEIDADAFDSLFAAEAAALGHDLRGADVLTCLSGDVRPRVVAAMDALKAAGFRLGCITNNVPAGEGPGMSRTLGKAAEVADAMTRFEHIIESSKAGVRKPDPRIYQMMCEMLGVEPAACIYLDDLGINCKPASAL